MGMFRLPQGYLHSSKSHLKTNIDKNSLRHDTDHKSCKAKVLQVFSWILSVSHCAFPSLSSGLQVEANVWKCVGIATKF